MHLIDGTKLRQRRDELGLKLRELEARTRLISHALASGDQRYSAWQLGVWAHVGRPGAWVPWTSIKSYERAAREDRPRRAHDYVIWLLALALGMEPEELAITAQPFDPVMALQEIETLLTDGTASEAARWCRRAAAAAECSGWGAWSQFFLEWSQSFSGQSAQLCSKEARGGAADPRPIVARGRRTRRCPAPTRAGAHKDGVPHSSVILFVKAAPGRVLCYKRDPRQDQPGKLDCFGGHVEIGDIDHWMTALREANDELQLSLKGRRIAWSRRLFQQVGETGEWRQESPDNREWSTLFLVAVPERLQVDCFDEVLDESGLRTIQLQARSMLLKEIEALPPDRLADGLRRVIDRYRADGGFRRQLDTWLAKQPGQQTVDAVAIAREPHQYRGERLREP